MWRASFLYAFSAACTMDNPSDHVAEPLPSPYFATGAATTDAEDYAMYGFSFVDETMAGMPQPGARAPLETDLQWMSEQGVTFLVSSTLEPTDPLAVEAAGLGFLHVPIPDMEAPTEEQQIAFVAAVALELGAGGRVGVHCMVGLGRTGTLIATWFVDQGMTADEAIAFVREQRPGSIESLVQEDSVHRYELSLP